MELPPSEIVLRSSGCHGKEGQDCHHDHQSISISDIPQIKESEKTEKLVQRFQGHLSSGSDHLEGSSIYSALFQTLKGEFVFIMFFYLANIATTLGVSVLLQKLFESVARQEDEVEMYLLALASGMLIYLDAVMRHNCFYEGPKISGCMRSCLISLMFGKVCSLTQ